RNVFVHSLLHQCRSTVGDGRVDHRGDGVLAGARGRPHLTQIVPPVVLVEEADDVAYPAAHQVGPCHRDVHHMAAAPVVAYQVDRLLEALQLGDQPAAVLLHRGCEPWGQGSAETRWGQTHDGSAIEERSQSVPDSSSLGVAMDEAHRHEGLLSNVY